METLLKPGDMIRIRKDINEDDDYHMILSKDSLQDVNSWTKSMAPANSLVTIAAINIFGQYYILDNNDEEDVGWSYTDQMFDPETLDFLLRERFSL
jgi:hypothetical protein